MERRDFLIKAGRMIMAAILALITFLALRRGQAGCTESPFCGNCNLLATCGLPRAARFRPQYDKAKDS
jgi:hypothetical protein